MEAIRRYKGFTLIELMITLALSAIILAFAVPSFQDIIRNNRLTAHTNEFVAALQLARSEAIKRGTRITLCKSLDGSNCASNSNGYEQGWIVFIDLDNDANVDVGEEIIRVHSNFEDNNMSLTGNSNVADYLSFVADGTTRLATGTANGAFQAGTLTLCKTPKARQIIVSSTGRLRLATDATC